MGNAIGDLIGLALIILAVIFAGVWIFFPFLILSKMNELLKELQKLNSVETLRLDQSINPDDEQPEA